MRALREHGHVHAQRFHPQVELEIQLFDRSACDFGEQLGLVGNRVGYDGTAA